MPITISGTRYEEVPLAPGTEIMGVLVAGNTTLELARTVAELNLPAGTSVLLAGSRVYAVQQDPAIWVLTLMELRVLYCTLITSRKDENLIQKVRRLTKSNQPEVDAKRIVEKLVSVGLVTKKGDLYLSEPSLLEFTRKEVCAVVAVSRKLTDYRFSAVVTLKQGCPGWDAINKALQGPQNKRESSLAQPTSPATERSSGFKRLHRQILAHIHGGNREQAIIFVSEMLIIYQEQLTTEERCFLERVSHHLGQKLSQPSLQAALQLFELAFE